MNSYKVQNTMVHARDSNNTNVFEYKKVCIIAICVMLLVVYMNDAKTSKQHKTSCCPSWITSCCLKILLTPWMERARMYMTSHELSSDFVDSPEQQLNMADHEQP